MNTNEQPIDHRTSLRWVVIGPLLGLLLIFLGNCTGEVLTVEHPGAVVAATYCSTCHLVPDPGDLPRNIWEREILPKMGAFLGKYVNKSRMHYLVSAKTAPYLEDLYPVETTIDTGDWALLNDYYLTMSPATPLITPEPAAIRKMRQFSVRPVFVRGKETDAPYTTLLEFDSLRREIIVGAAGQDGGRLRTFDREHSLVDVRYIDSAPGAVDLPNGLVLSMGSLVPSDLPQGKLSRYTEDSAQALLDTLARPVAMLRLDLDQDGLEELIVAEFGNMAGALNTYLPDADGKYRLQRTLSGRSGAIRLRAVDLDRDGWTDLVALFGQGDESVVAYLSRPGGVERN